MKVDTFIDKKIEQKFIERNKKERTEHISSGKLSAGMLNDPLQWQILKVLKVEPRPLDEYVLRKFFRGNQIEEWVIKEIPDIVETQKFVEYKNTIGYIDAVIDTKNWDFKVGIIPAEVKSVANAKYRRIIERGPDKGHILQAGFYALAEKTEQFAVIYIASDDLRIKVYIYETKDYKQEIDEIIERFYKQLKSGKIPVFEAREVWQENFKYCRYPDFMKLNQRQLDKILELKVNK